MTTFGNFIFAGGRIPYGTAEMPVDPAAPVKAEPPLPRDTVSVAYPWIGFEKAPPASDSVFFRMRRHPTCELAFAITTAPVFAGTRAATIRNADGTIAASSGTPTGIGAEVTQTPEEKRRKALDDLFEDQWADLLVGLECYNFGRWTQEVVWDRKADTIAPVRFKSFLPWEVQLQRDKFNDFAGFKHGQIERDARYAFHSVCRPHFDPIFGMPRAESARESWWRSLQCHENGDAIEKKASGVQMAIGIMTGMTFRDAAGVTITAEDSIQRIKNAAATGATWTYPLLAFDKASVQANPELAKLPAMKVDQFDWGDTGSSLVAAISRLDRLDKEILRAWCRPEREAMEGEHGTKAEAGVHGAIGTIDSERVHSDFLRQLNRQVVNRWLVTNFGPDAADTIYFKAAPLADPQQEFKQAIATAMLNSPTAGPQLQANVDGRRLLKDTELPLVPVGAVAQVVPMEMDNGEEAENLGEDEDIDGLFLSASNPKDGDGDGMVSGPDGKDNVPAGAVEKKKTSRIVVTKRGVLSDKIAYFETGGDGYDATHSIWIENSTDESGNSVYRYTDKNAISDVRANGEWVANKELAKSQGRQYGLSLIQDYAFGGKRISGFDPAVLTAAPDGATIKAKPTKDGRIEVEVSSDDYGGLEMKRSYGVDENGPFVVNDMFRLEETGTGAGTTIFGKQIDALRDQGFTRMQTTAAKRSASGEDSFNGYYTWARLGYDGDIPKSVREKLPESLAGSKRVSQLMATSEGVTFWKKNGEAFDGTFAITKDRSSLSERVFYAYLEAKSKRRTAA